MNKKLITALCMLVSFGLFMLGSLDSFGLFKIEALGGALNLASLFVILGGSFFQAFVSFPTEVVIKAIQRLRPPFLRKTIQEDRLESTMNLLRQLKADKQGTIQSLTDGQAKGFRLYLAELLSTNYNTEEIRILVTTKSIPSSKKTRCLCRRSMFWLPPLRLTGCWVP